LAGEVKNFNVSKEEVKDIVRNTVKRIGYEQEGFHWDKLNIYNEIHSQSADIALGTDDFGAGDQGIMFGYACNDNDAYMPAPIYYSHEILKKLKEYRSSGYDYLGPDAKSQVSVEYEGGKVKRIDQIVVSHQHKEGFQHSVKMPIHNAVEEVLSNLIDKNTVWHINPTGNFVIGGPDGDAGVTGRKIIVDTYGGFAPHGGGAFSGKDPTKVDRSAAYMARWLAKNVVADDMADWCQIQLSYAIGVKEPTSIYVDSNGHNRSIERFIRENIDLTPKGIIDRFDLFNFTAYSTNCTYGHFGDKNVPWERIGW
jgi:S-adenosylmethionine synthetase